MSNSIDQNFDDFIVNDSEFVNNDNSNDTNNIDTNNTNDNEIINNKQTTLFRIQDFVDELKRKSHEKNKRTHERKHKTINAYDISTECIRKVLFKMLGFPLNNYADNWLPVHMRATIGNGIHEFIQNSDIFTENELVLKVPSINISVRLDSVINNNVLVGIKSVSYDDYTKILKKQQPRTQDLYQEFLYVYLLHNYLDELKQQTPYYNFKVPSLNKYDIQYIQFIYVCHELLSGTTDNINEAINISKTLKRTLNSRSNPFWFITTLTLNINNINQETYIEFIKEKIDEINKHVANKQVPDMNHKFTDTKKCFFCIYKNTCKKI